jgi:RNA methyltransferase, TrmH family
MSEQIITSRDNALVKRARAVRDGKVREQIFVEGLRLCEEALQALGVDDITDVIYTERIARDRRGARLLAKLKNFNARLASASESVFSSISDTKTPQGIVMLAARPNTGPSALLKNEVPLIVVLHRINNPSNAGAILRAAEAAGATAVVLTEGSADIFSPKALRGAMGSSLRLPLWTGARFQEVVEWCGERGVKTICTDLRAERAHTEIDWTAPAALILGEEAGGLTPEEVASSDEALRIPMRPPVESLNVALAAAIVLYEAARQRVVVGGQWSVKNKKEKKAAECD